MLRLGRAGAAIRAAVRVEGAATLAGCGTVAGALTNAGTVAAGCPDAALVLEGDYAQAVGATLSARGLRVAGTVTLAGAFTPPAEGGDSAVTVVDNTGDRPVSGTFDGLAEGAALRVGDRTMTPTYRGGDGNDVVLVPQGGGASADGVPLAGGLTARSGPPPHLPMIKASL